MIVIDSSFWIEFFIGTKNGAKIISLLENEDEILVPAIVITEVYKKFLNDSTIEIATSILRKLSTFKIVTFDYELSVLSATLSKEYKLPLADSIIYATAMKHNAEIYTFDKHFENLPNVKYFQK